MVSLFVYEKRKEDNYCVKTWQDLVVKSVKSILFKEIR